ncbi:hypothetical protein phD2B_001 [Lelliottia phage phD2B]|uniref:Uncharacterized protein n=1 Tax=Lelliottia phage phD2B TaxID=1542498 RepID=A0A088FS15_9CAUD|nr:hypothetical protein phD2B_001 [Lelliottia phage phD2B]AIM51228.1 hypothetical protein phD2B_001 [Lelliottia phage phD2B]
MDSGNMMGTLGQQDAAQDAYDVGKCTSGRVRAVSVPLFASASFVHHVLPCGIPCALHDVLPRNYMMGSLALSLWWA